VFVGRSDVPSFHGAPSPRQDIGSNTRTGGRAWSHELVARSAAPQPASSGIRDRQHVLIAVAMNLKRVMAWFTHPQPTTRRVSPFAALASSG
jgi:hypothetical protein